MSRIRLLPADEARGDAAPAPHPEEIKATADLHLGPRIRLQASVRTTPAGLVTGAIAVATITLAFAALVRAARAR